MLHEPRGDVRSDIGRPDRLVEPEEDYHRGAGSTAAPVPVRVQEPDGRCSEVEAVWPGETPAADRGRRRVDGDLVPGGVRKRAFRVWREDQNRGPRPSEGAGDRG